ncbi:MAG: thiol-disulfide oxidoreductase [Acidobacteria bacterium]|nr:MAG: thiol-disulfide oxidoreductase [Acidobacteriota bacterium]
MVATVLFDGVCNFCNGAVNFVIARDKAGYFKFAPLQSEIGEQLTVKHGIDPAKTDSIVLVEDDHAYVHSTAALKIARRLDRPWPIFYAVMIVPRPIRDVAYKLFAKYRYKLFGRQDACMIPTPDVRERFL